MYRTIGGVELVFRCAVLRVHGLHGDLRACSRYAMLRQLCERDARCGHCGRSRGDLAVSTSSTLLRGGAHAAYHRKYAWCAHGDALFGTAHSGNALGSIFGSSRCEAIPPSVP